MGFNALGSVARLTNLGSSYAARTKTLIIMVPRMVAGLFMDTCRSDSS